MMVIWGGLQSGISMYLGKVQHILQLVGYLNRHIQILGYNSKEKYLISITEIARLKLSGVVVVMMMIIIIRVEAVYNDIVLYDTSSITSGYSVLPINFSLITLTLHYSVTTTLAYFIFPWYNSP
jgi:hypothetical protein